MKKTYDLEERTALFGEMIIDLCKIIPLNIITKRLIDQLLRSGTSIGANYAEANAASSRRDFRNKIYVTKKECRETTHWLRMIAKAVPDKKPQIRIAWKEGFELTLIFQKITSSLDENDHKRKMNV